MPRIESRVIYSHGVIGSLSVEDLKAIIEVFDDWALTEKAKKEPDKGKIETLDKAIQYFQHVIETETQVGRIS